MATSVSAGGREEGEGGAAAAGDGAINPRTRLLSQFRHVRVRVHFHLDEETGARLIRRGRLRLCACALARARWRASHTSMPSDICTRILPSTLGNGPLSGTSSSSSSDAGSSCGKPSSDSVMESRYSAFLNM